MHIDDSHFVSSLNKLRQKLIYCDCSASEIEFPITEDPKDSIKFFFAFYINFRQVIYQIRAR